MVIIKSLFNKNGENEVAELLKEISNQSEAHGKFIIIMLEQLRIVPLHKLVNEDTELTIDNEDGTTLTRRYRLVKPLRKEPIYELRYGISANEHLRILFFPLYFNGEKYYMFTHAYIKVKKPPFDPTNKLRDESFNMYLSIKDNPEKIHD